MPRLKTSVNLKELTTGDISAVIQMAWEDRTTFETIMERIGVSESEVISTVDGRPGHQSVVITGRGGGAALQNLADTVSEVKDIKHAFNAGVKARKGVDY